MKKKQEIVIKVTDNDHFNKYMAPDYSKLICLNVFDKFWGPCEVLDPMVKKFIDTKDYAAKTDFVAAQKEFTGEFFPKHIFTSKPKFFIIYKGNIISTIVGLDFPKLQEELEKNFSLLEAE